MCAFWSGHVGSAAESQSELQGAVQGAAVSLVCALWSGHAGAAAGCCHGVLLQGAAVGVVCALWRWPAPLQGAAAGCCSRAL